MTQRPGSHNLAGEVIVTGVKQRYQDARHAPNHAAFSNTTSAKAWNDEYGDDVGLTTAAYLESPHGVIYLATGGLEILSQNVDTTEGAGANGNIWARMIRPRLTSSCSSTTASSI